MRWFASLVVLCLLAGTGVRPRAELREPHAATELAAAEGVAALVSSRRGGTIVPEIRHRGVGPFVVTPVAPALVAPTRRIAPAPRGPVEHGSSVVLRVHSARGPPSGRFSVEIHRS